MQRLQVSQYRVGKVRVFEPTAGSMRLMPWPDPTLHPVLAEQALAAGYDYYDEPLSDNDEQTDEGGALGSGYRIRAYPGAQTLGLANRVLTD